MLSQKQNLFLERFFFFFFVMFFVLPFQILNFFKKIITKKLESKINLYGQLYVSIPSGSFSEILLKPPGNHVINVFHSFIMKFGIEVNFR